MRRTASKARTPLLLLPALLLVASAAGCRGQGGQPAPNAPPPAAQARPDNLCSDPKYRQIPLPAPDGFVNDFADVIEQPAEERLEERLADLQARAKVDLALVTVKTTGGASVFDYSLAVACGWGVGQKGEGGGGIVLLLVVEERQWRIQVGRALEADLPNEAVAEIGKSMEGSFRQKLYGEGLIKGVEDIIRRLYERGRFKSQAGARRPDTI